MLYVPEIVKKAWKEAPIGVSSMEGHKVIKNNKMLLIIEDLDKNIKILKNPGEEDITPDIKIIAYPRLEHHVDFSNANENVKEHGPATHYPVSIGSIEASIPIHLRVADGGKNFEEILFEKVKSRVPAIGKKIINLNYIQAHFKAGDKEGFLPRSLATKYGGWRSRSISELIKIAEELNRDIIINNKFVKWRKKPELRKDIEKASKELGAKVLTGGQYLVIKPHQH